MIGNYYLHEIVKSGDYELRIDLQDQNGERAYAGYKHFMIGGPSTSYLLEVSGFYGNASMLDYTIYQSETLVYRESDLRNDVNLLILKNT